MTRTISGGVTINGTLLHYALDDLPFGGAGASGFGAYHGIEGFRAFSHQKAVFDVGRWNVGALLRPPFGRLTNSILGWMLHTSQPPIEVRNEIVVPAPIDRVWDLLADVERWPSWYGACRWVRVDSPATAGHPLVFRWKTHAVEWRSTVVTSDRPHAFAITADAVGLRAKRTFTVRPTSDGVGTLVASHETQVGPLAWLGRAVLRPRLYAANQAMFDDLARAAAISPRG